MKNRCPRTQSGRSPHYYFEHPALAPTLGPYPQVDIVCRLYTSSCRRSRHFSHRMLYRIFDFCTLREAARRLLERLLFYSCYINPARPVSLYRTRQTFRNMAAVVVPDYTSLPICRAANIPLQACGRRVLGFLNSPQVALWYEAGRASLFKKCNLYGHVDDHIESGICLPT